MIYRKIDNYGDMVFGGNANDFYSGKTAVGQAIFTTLRLYQGEWWEDQSVGLPLFQSILGQNGAPEHIRGVDMLIQEQIMGVPGVVSISSFDSTFDSASRTYSIQNAMVQTQYGDLVLEGVIFSPNAQYELTLFPAIAKV